MRETLRKRSSPQRHEEHKEDRREKRDENKVQSTQMCPCQFLPALCAPFSFRFSLCASCLCGEDKPTRHKKTRLPQTEGGNRVSWGSWLSGNNLFGGDCSAVARSKKYFFDCRKVPLCAMPGGPRSWERAGTAGKCASGLQAGKSRTRFARFRGFSSATSAFRAMAGRAETWSKSWPLVVRMHSGGRGARGERKGASSSSPWRCPCPPW